jgi:hypothetical protein
MSMQTESRHHGSANNSWIEVSLLTFLTAIAIVLAWDVIAFVWDYAW